MKYSHPCRPSVATCSLFFFFLSCLNNCTLCLSNKLKSNEIAIASHRHHFDHSVVQQPLIHDNAQSFKFQRYQSSKTIKHAFDNCRNPSCFKWFQGKDGRKGYVSSTKLGGDWVLAESEQIAVDCTTKDVLKAYLTGSLQQEWNKDQVLNCQFHVRHKGLHHEPYYEQELTLKSQRVIASHTGIMKYSQTLSIDEIGHGDYTVMVRLDPSKQIGSTVKKPFESLNVYVGLHQDGKDVKIYASGIMQVNRKVVPNLLVFDASGIAGQLAGKGTLWLAAFFEKRRNSRS